MQTGSRNSAALKAHDRHEQSTSLINMHQSQQKATEVSDVDFKKFVLYVSGGREEDGQQQHQYTRKQLCIKSLESLKSNASLKIDTLIIYADDLLTKPAWLNQLPCLVFKEEKKALSGQACLSYLNSSEAKDYKSNLKTFQKRRNFGHVNCWKV